MFAPKAGTGEIHSMSVFHKTTAWSVLDQASTGNGA
jgi:hypothetical protein